MGASDTLSMRQRAAVESSGSSERSGVFVSSLMDQGLSVTVDKPHDDAEPKWESSDSGKNCVRAVFTAICAMVEII